MTKCPSCSYNYPDGCDATCDYKHPMTEWISVKDSYPEELQKVVFYVENREESFCGFYERFPKHRRINSVLEHVFYENLDGWWFEDESITHWMPLPNPPGSM